MYFWDFHVYIYIFVLFFVYFYILYILYILYIIGGWWMVVVVEGEGPWRPRETTEASSREQILAQCRESSTL